MNTAELQNIPSIDSLFQKARAFQRRGQLKQVKNLCEKILEQEPNHIPGFNLLAQVYQSNKNYTKAVEQLNKALAVNPNHLNTLANLGQVHLLNGEPKICENYFNKVLKLDPRNPAIFTKFAQSFQKANRVKMAIEHYQKAIKLDPHFVKAFIFAGRLLSQINRLPAAHKLLTNGLGHNPKNRGILFELGLVCFKLKRFKQAKHYFEVILEAQPKTTQVSLELGKTLIELKQFDDAKALLKEIVNRAPNYVPAYIQLAAIYRNLGKLDDTLETCQKLIELEPNSARNYANLGIAYQDLGRFDDAKNACLKAIEINPKHVNAHFSLGVMMLSQGHFEEGWPYYQWRFKTDKLQKLQKNFPQPQWDGKTSLKGKRIFVWREQGFGDYIHMARYFEILSKKGAKVISECQPQLLSLAKTIKSIDEVVEFGEEYSNFDLHCPLMDLPYLCHTSVDTIPNKAPYIHACPKRVKQLHKKLPKGDKIKIGLVWAGSVTNLGDYHRSLVLTDFESLFDFQGAQFIGLQVGPKQSECENFSHDNFFNLGTDIKDFSDTAALISQLDLVICVDTASAHLAGALNVPVWTLIPVLSDWRWQRDREDCPWYPSMRLFRQKKLGAWLDVLDVLFDEVKRFVKPN